MKTNDGDEDDVDEEMAQVSAWVDYFFPCLLSFEF